ncbi:MAG: hypothetical protein Q9177_001433 [Variospora cf. flavescens]
MTDARRSDQNYGHFGEPVYDVESHEWDFPRRINKPLQLRPLGKHRLLLAPQLATFPANVLQTAARRHKEVKQLVRAHPELAPSSTLLPSLAETSEAIQQSTSKYDSAISDLLAFGRALHPLHRRESARFVPVVTIPAGAAGELVKVIQCIPEIVGWGDDLDRRLYTDALESRVQGLWRGNGSPIQQLQFAKSNGEPTEWLAVRYGGTTSILRVVLREKEVPMPYGLSSDPAIEANVEHRMELEHIATVSTQQSGVAPHADVCFNPWNHREFAILNRSSCWSTWRITSIKQTLVTWTVEAGSSGTVAEDSFNDARNPAGKTLNHDGWGAVRWASDGACLLVCNRWRLVCIKLQDRPIEMSMPDLAVTRGKDWIRDIKEAPTHPEYFFIATSSRVIWLQVTLVCLVGQDQTQKHVSAQILFTWAHFRNELDTSLWMQVIALRTTTSPHLRHPIEALRYYGRTQPLRKSSYRVDDDFIVPDGMLDFDGQSARSTRASSLDVNEQGQPTPRNRSCAPSEDQWTINLEWLVEHINSAPNIPLQEASQIILGKLSDKIESMAPGIVSLNELIDQEVALGDIDEISTALNGLLHDVERGRFGRGAASVGVPEEPVSLSRLTSMSLPVPLPLESGGQLLHTYDALVSSWVMSLNNGLVAARWRAMTERTIRYVAAELHLASYGVSMQSRDEQASEQRPMSSNEEAATFALPVRGRPLFSQDSRRVRAKAIEQTSIQLGSSHVINEHGSVPAASLPTPEPTPSLRSHGSQSSQSSQGGMEDPAVARLRALADVTHQPLLPNAIEGNLDHWVVDQSPDNYDWKHSKERAEQGEKPEDDEEATRAKKRRRKERSAIRRTETMAMSTPQAVPSRLAASQVELSNHPQSSSQPSLVTASQPVPGPHGGAIKAKKGRKKGF